MLGSNFEKILIEVFTNRVNHTGKRWAVNNNSNCLLIELPGVSKKKLLSWFSPYFSSRGRILLFFLQKMQKILIQRKNLHSYLRCWTQKSLVVGVAMEEIPAATYDWVYGNLE